VLTDKGRRAGGFRSIPIVGGIPAGVPVIAEEMYEGLLHVRRELGQSGDFALRVVGDSMSGAGIFDGDYVLVRSQDHAEHGSVVVILISGYESEGSLKAFFLRPDDVVFAPANSDYEPIILPRDSDAWRILGVVVAVVRVGTIRVSMPLTLRKSAN
jgi:repressor LexA